MITEKDLQEAIKECEGVRNPTSSTCLKLAAYYTIQDKMYPMEKGTDPEVVPAYSYAADPEPVEYSSDTEFARAIQGMSMEQLFPLIDDLMSTVQVVCPRLYDGVMRKLSEYN